MFMMLDIPHPWPIRLTDTQDIGERMVAKLPMHGKWEVHMFYHFLNSVVPVKELNEL